jgi:hypothetical protein
MLNGSWTLSGLEKFSTSGHGGAYGVLSLQKYSGSGWSEVASASGGSPVVLSKSELPDTSGKYRFAAYVRNSSGVISGCEYYQNVSCKPIPPCVICQTQVDVFWGPVLYSFNNGTASIRYGQHNNHTHKRIISTVVDKATAACFPVISLTQAEPAIPSFSPECDLSSKQLITATIDMSHRNAPAGYIGATIRINASAPAKCGPYMVGLATYKADYVTNPSYPNDIDKQEYYDSKTAMIKPGDAPITLYVRAPMNGDGKDCHSLPGENSTSTTITTTTSTVKPTTTTIIPVVPCASSSACTYTQGGWGAKPSGNNPGKLLSDNWATITGGTLQVGSGRYSIRFTSAKAVENYLPAGGRGALLSRNYTNPTSTSSGVLGGQLTALKLNVLASDARVTGNGTSVRLGDLYVRNGPFAGDTVREFLRFAERILGKDPTASLPSGATISSLTDTADSLNRAYDGCRAIGNSTAASCGPVAKASSKGMTGFFTRIVSLLFPSGQN